MTADEDAARRRELLLLTEAIRGEALADLASGIAHEVNNALSGILNYAQLAQRCAPGSPHHAESLEGIVAEGRRILELNRALLTYARRSETASPVGLSDVVRAALAPVRRQLREELVAVEVDVPAEVPQVLARAHELQAVVHYVVGWARRAARLLPPRTRTSLAFRASYELDPEPGHVTLDVQHQGLGEPDPLERQRCVELLAAVGGALTLGTGSARITLAIA